MKHNKKEKQNKRFTFQVSRFRNGGFTTIELVVVIVILSVLATVVITNFALQKKKTDLTGSVWEIASVLRLAQSKTLASTNNSQYGVYFDTSASPHQYVLFKGASYALRDTSADNIYLLPAAMEFNLVSLGGGSEIMFDKLAGTTAQPGSLSLRMKLDTSQSETIYVANSGSIDVSTQAIPSDDDRIKDSRHLHFDYSKAIDTAGESITLTFNGNVTQVILIGSYVSGSEFSWEGIVSAGGTDQTVKIHTHRLNNPDTQFSVHRDRRFNDKTLLITVSGDGSGDLASYSADGATTTFSSIYVSNFSWQ